MTDENKKEAAILEDEKQMLSHIVMTYREWLNVERDLHMIGGFLSREQSCAVVAGISFPHAPLERLCYQMSQQEEPKRQVGVEDAIGVWFIYFDNPDDLYEENNLGHHVEILTTDADGGVTRVYAKYPPDFPEAPAMAGYTDAFMWEMP